VVLGVIFFWKTISIVRKEKRDRYKRVLLFDDREKQGILIFYKLGQGILPPILEGESLSCPLFAEGFNFEKKRGRNPASTAYKPET